METDNWEQDLKTRVVSPNEINEQFDSLAKITDDLCREALLANVELSVCGQICYCKTTLKRIRRTALTDPRILWNVNSPPLSSNSDIRNREDVRVRNMISGSRSNIDKTYDYSRD